ncbi:MAG: MOSC domain-containing protein [Chloroflexaceae bacterium]|nr:MOSC domain-containing protein [Chloroflexaceae bacterium]
MLSDGMVVSINVNPAGGVPKYAVPEADVTLQGVRGDTQRDLKHHGGPQRAVSLYSFELIQALRAEGHPIAPGTTGENLTLRGLAWATLQIGDQLAIGERLVIEITDYATPCATIADSFSDNIFTRIAQKRYPGWSRLYAQVLIEGRVCAGDRVVLTVL